MTRTGDDGPLLREVGEQRFDEAGREQRLLGDGPAILRRGPDQPGTVEQLVSVAREEERLFVEFRDEGSRGLSGSRGLRQYRRKPIPSGQVISALATPK